MTTAPEPLRYGLEQARAQLPLIASEATAGYSSVITRHGKPVAVVVPIAQWEQAQQQAEAQRACTVPGLLALRGSGRGLWGEDSARTVADLRDEWERG